MRHARVKAEGVGHYHVVSRIVDRTFRLDDGEKEIFRGMLRRAEAFCGVRVLTYAVMSNHFHLLVEVGERVEVDEAELVRRMTIPTAGGRSPTPCGNGRRGGGRARRILLRTSRISCARGCTT